jgi:DNA-binding PadR family transcriptional regulator
MDAKTIVLGLLTCGSRSGYELKRFFTISFSFFSGLSFGSIYPALRSLERAGLVTMRREKGRAAAGRKVYSVTAAGRKAFREALLAPAAAERFRSPLLMRLFFFAALSPTERQRIVREFGAAVRRQREDLAAAEPAIRAAADPFQYESFLFGQRFYRDLERNVAQLARALRGGGGTR